MHPIEKAAIAVRRSRLFKNAGPLWKAIRPIYVRQLRRWKRNGLERTINGTDSILIAPDLYNTPEEYEPEVWHALMREVKPGSIIADVGAYVGLYTVALAKRVGPQGMVHAFEPEPQTSRTLQWHVKANRVGKRVRLWRCAVGSSNGTTLFVSGQESQSHLAAQSEPAGQAELNGARHISVPVTTLDSALGDGRLDVLKVDVEGFEEQVLQGARELLSDEARAPRVIFIEVHPYAWEESGSSSDSLLGLLRALGYEIFDLEGKHVNSIADYGEVIARRVSLAG